MRGLRGEMQQVAREEDGLVPVGRLAHDLREATDAAGYDVSKGLKGLTDPRRWPSDRAARAG